MFDIIRCHSYSETLTNQTHNDGTSVNFQPIRTRVYVTRAGLSQWENTWGFPTDSWIFKTLSIQSMCLKSVHYKLLSEIGSASMVASRESNETGLGIYRDKCKLKKLCAKTCSETGSSVLHLNATIEGYAIVYLFATKSKKRNAYMGSTERKS